MLTNFRGPALIIFAVLITVLTSNEAFAWGSIHIPAFRGKVDVPKVDDGSELRIILGLQAYRGALTLTGQTDAGEAFYSFKVERDGSFQIPEIRHSKILHPFAWWTISALVVKVPSGFLFTPDLLSSMLLYPPEDFASINWTEIRNQFFEAYGLELPKGWRKTDPNNPERAELVAFKYFSSARSIFPHGLVAVRETKPAVEEFVKHFGGTITPRTPFITRCMDFVNGLAMSARSTRNRR